MYFNTYEAAYLACVLEKMKKHLVKEDKEVRLAALAYKVKVK